MSQPFVGVDADGVLADFEPHLISHINALYNTSYTLRDNTHYELDRLIPEHEIASFWKSFGETIRFHHALEPLPGAIEGIERLKTIADVYIVTAHLHTAPTWVYDRDQWLAKHFGFDKYKIIHTFAKHMFGGDMLIDDKIGNIEAWRTRYPQGVGVLWSQRYNEGSNVGTIRTSDWNEVCDLIERVL